MSKLSKKKFKPLRTEAFHRFLAEQFGQVEDKRAPNRSISMRDALMSGFAMYSLKYPSLLQFNNELPNNRENLRSLYHVSTAPSDTAMRKILDDVSPGSIKSVQAAAVGLMRDAGVFRAFEYKGYLIASADGVQHYNSEKVHCTKCAEVNKKNGIKEYRHSMLSAVLVHPDKNTVLPLVHEPITRQDGAAKNDCERNASARLLPELAKVLAGQRAIVVEDALGANAPHIELLTQLGLSFAIGVKPDGHKHLFSQIDDLELEGKTQWGDKFANDQIYVFRWANGLSLNADNPEVKVNFLECIQIDSTGKKPEQHFTWVTDLPLDKRSVYKVMRMARSRWKIENETFNTLKNQGYNFEHNFGHGKNELCSVLAMLMMLAFLCDQLQQEWNEAFQSAWRECGSKTVMWAKQRFAIDFLDLPSVEVLYGLLSRRYKIEYQLFEPSG